MDPELTLFLRTALIGFAGSLLLEILKGRMEARRDLRQAELETRARQSDQVETFLGGEQPVVTPPPAWLRQKSAARRNPLARLGLRSDEAFCTQAQVVRRQTAAVQTGKKKGKRTTAARASEPRPTQPVKDRRAIRRKWLLDRSQVLGRGSQCDILVLDPAVSLVHALIRYEEGGYILYDLGSSTGTLMNGRLVGSLGEPLARGTLIQIGDTVFEFGMIPGTAPQKAA